MPEVRATNSFFDMSCKAVRNAGDEFFCDDERAATLAAYGMVEVLGVPADDVPAVIGTEPDEEAPKPSKKKKGQK